MVLTLKQLNLVSLTIGTKTQARVKTIKNRKDKTFIFRMLKTLTMLENKYLIPRHIRKKQLFMTKQKNSPTILKELTYNVLAAPEPEKLTGLETVPHVTWNDVKFKSAIPYPESCPVLSCSCSPHYNLYGSGDS